MSPASLLVALCLAQAPAVAADEDEAEAPAEAKPAKKAQPPPATPPTTEEVSAQAKAPKPAPSEGVWKQGKPLPDMPPAKPVDPSVVTDAADGTARIGRALIGRDIETLVLLTPAPFSFDGVVAKTPAEVRQHWAETLDRHPVERLRLYGVRGDGLPADGGEVRPAAGPAHERQPGRHADRHRQPERPRDDRRLEEAEREAGGGGDLGLTGYFAFTAKKIDSCWRSTRSSASSPDLVAPSPSRYSATL